MATATDLRKRITSKLLDEIREVQYPSTTMLDRVEPALADRQDLADYIEVLVEKVEGTQFPSISLINRINGLLDQLDQVEQQQRQRQQAESSRDDGSGEESDDRERELQAA